MITRLTSHFDVAGTMKRKGLTIRIRDYFKIGAVLSILEVTAASVILWLEITYVGLRLSG